MRHSGWKPAWTAALLAMVGSVHCRVSGFTCQDDAQCQGAGPQPACEPTGACSVADGDCDSGRRYADGGGSMAGTCVPAADSSTSSGAGSSSTDTQPAPDESSSSEPLPPDTTSGTTMAVDDTSTDTGRPPETGSTTGVPISPEVCDGVDNDGDGLVDEYSEFNDACDGCALGQHEDAAWWACASPRTWQEAVDDCAALGAQLGRVLTSGENEFLTNLAGGESLWLGADDIRIEAEWTWLDGAALSINHNAWAAGQPDDDGPTAEGEDCLHLTSAMLFMPGDWNDDVCDAPYGMACKAPHRP
ncbi:MAG: C-type lectin domain-containing protein [Deltaproteobacteria bacterium]|nr:C-type lectin domain-containing protein [Deltaproteobacteria bacterium]